MIDLFPTKLYLQKSNYPDLNKRLATSITKLYDERAYYLEKNPLKGKHWRKLGLYDSEGNHAYDKGKDSMEGVDGWKTLRAIIHQHALKYFKEMSDYMWIEQLEEYWPVQAWWSVFDETDDYPWHHHSQYCLIGTYYVQQEEEHAPITFRSPINSLVTSSVPGISKLNLEETIYPETGDLLMWPAWLEHEVPGTDSYIYKKDDSQGLNKSYPDPDNIKYEKLRISITVCFLKPDIMLGYNNEKRK